MLFDVPELGGAVAVCGDDTTEQPPSLPPFQARRHFAAFGLPGIQFIFPEIFLFVKLLRKRNERRKGSRMIYFRRRAMARKEKANV